MLLRVIDGTRATSIERLLTKKYALREREREKMKIWMGSARKLFFFFLFPTRFFCFDCSISKNSGILSIFLESLVFDLFIYNNLNNRKKGGVKESSSSRGRKI